MLSAVLTGQSEAEVQLELARRVLVVAVAHVEAEPPAPQSTTSSRSRTELLELVDVVAVRLGQALGQLALLGLSSATWSQARYRFRLVTELLLGYRFLMGSSLTHVAEEAREGQLHRGPDQAVCYHIHQFEELRPVLLDVVDWGQRAPPLDMSYGDHEDAPGQLD